ncbi:hypothetical protein E2C01_053004 [Portunus trituberculatus]|uniref:Uncharacterized protein n=1 Tax=Portunus trituberculatus TaxID=210409 RepID=A0A5B7GN08_PORTR|nr:hypothetical protein [Portunus trituberculatus]
MSPLSFCTHLPSLSHSSQPHMVSLGLPAGVLRPPRSPRELFLSLSGKPWEQRVCAADNTILMSRAVN